MKKNRILLFAIIPLAAALLSACGTPPANTWPGLAADARNAYLAGGSQVYAVDLENGDEVWHYPEKVDGALVFYAPPAVLPDGRVLIGSAGSNSCLFIIEPAPIDAETRAAPGRCLFAGAKDHWVAAPLVVENTAYAPNNNGHLYALDLTDGSLLWSLEVGGHLWSTPATDGAKLYVSSLDHNVYAIDLESRTVVWKTDLGGPVPGSPVLSADGSTLFVGSFAAKVFALDAASGAITWSKGTQDWVWGQPALDGETLYYADLDGNVYSLDLASGRQNWGEVKPNGPVGASPLVVDGQIIVVAESGTVFALDPQGDLIWDPEIGGKIYTPAVTSGEFVLIAPFQAESLLVALDLNGRQAWKFPEEK